MLATLLLGGIALGGLFLLDDPGVAPERELTFPKNEVNDSPKDPPEKDERPEPDPEERPEIPEEKPEPTEPITEEPEPRPEPDPNKELPRVAIIIDDLGNSFEADRKIDMIQADLSLAVLPFREYTKRSLDFFKDKQEIILHLPLEPSNESQKEEKMLTVDMSEKEIVENFNLALEEMESHVSGLNSHKGSLFTSDKKSMQILLEEVKNKELFFVDSFTIASSVTFSLAKEMGVETAKRDVFLDGQRDKEYIRDGLQETVSLAERQGQAIAIGHVFPETIEVLKQEMPKLKTRVNFVGVSELVE